MIPILEGRRFFLLREEDETGVSGTGLVAWGCQFPDGVVVLRWNTIHTSTGIYASVQDVEAIHGHDGATKVVWLDDGGKRALI